MVERKCGMENQDIQQFDDYIRNQMQNLEVSYGHSWSELSNKLDLESRQHVDQVARRAAAEYSAAYSPKSWEMMLGRMGAIEFRRRLVSFKVLEAALLILAVSSAIRLVHFPVEEIPANYRFAASEVTSPDLSSSQEPLTLQDNHDNQITHPIVAVTQEDDNAVSSKPFAIQSSLATAISSTEQKSVVANGSRPEATAKVERLEVVEFRALEPVVNQIEALRFEIDHTPQIDEPRERAIHVAIREEAEAMLAAVHSDSKVTTKIGLYSQLNRHTMLTPHPFRRAVDYQQEYFDLAHGLMANVQFGRFGFDLGLAYEKVNFVSLPNLDPNEIRKVQIPVHLRYDLIRTKGFRTYLKGGIAANGILAASYAEPTFATAAPGPELQRKENDQKFNDGLLRKGGLANNSYMTASAGLGIEAKLTNNLYFFTEGLYQDLLTGDIGQEAMNLQTTSFQLGLLFSLD